MTDATLTCWSCEQEFTVRKRRGNYPRRCPLCAGLHTEAQAKTLARLAGRLLPRGTRPRVEPRLDGFIVVADLPWHDRPTTVVDSTDVGWIAAELLATKVAA